MIEGVQFKELTTNTDDRGFFRELIRNSDIIFKDGFGQLSHSLVYHGVIKAWHYHKIQTQWNYVANGIIKVVLCDLREDSPTFNKIMEFLAGENQPARLYAFPPWVAHGYKCINGPMNIIYVTSGVYDPGEEGRISPTDMRVPYNWASEIR